MSRAAIPFVAPLAALALATPLTAQVTLQAWTGPANENGFGSSVDTLGDVTGDGISDVAVSSDIFGSAFVLSGADGSMVHTFPGLGGRVARAGDVSGDGVPDLLMQFTPGLPSGPFVVQVRSGVDGALLVQVDDETYAQTVASVSDVDGDGARDLLVGSPAEDTGSIFDTGRVAVRSGSDGSLLYALAGGCEGALAGGMLADLGDVDGDGYGDFAFDDALPPPGAGMVSIVRVVSGHGGESLRSFEGGSSVWAVEDLDGDRRPELAIVCGSALVPQSVHTRIISTATWNDLLVIPGASDRPIRVGDVNGDDQADIAHVQWIPSVTTPTLCIRSMATGAELFDLGHPGGEFGSVLAPVQDLDGDGRVEFVVGQWVFDGFAGRVVLVSLVPASIAAVQPDSITMAELSVMPVQLLGQGLEYIDELHLGDQVLTLDDPAVTVVGPGHLSVQPSPTALGSVPVSVLNEGLPESNAVMLTFSATHPPVLAAEAVAFSGSSFDWKLFGGAGHTGLLLLSATSSTFTLKGWTVLREFILVTSVSLDALGTGGLELILPPAASGLAFFSQFATVQGGLIGTTNITHTLVAF